MIVIFSILECPVIKLNLHLKHSFYLNSNFIPTLGYLNTALNNLAQCCNYCYHYRSFSYLFLQCS